MVHAGRLRNDGARSVDTGGGADRAVPQHPARFSVERGHGQEGPGRTHARERRCCCASWPTRSGWTSWWTPELCRNIADLTGVGEEIEAELVAAVSDAERWLEKQSELRRRLFSGLDDAIVASDLAQVRTLRKHLRAVAYRDRTDAENETMAAADALVRAHAKQQQDAATARRAELQDERAEQAAGRARKLLGILERRGDRLSPEAMRKLVNEVVNEAPQAGARIDSHQQDQINAWKTRAESSRARPQTASRPAASSRTVARATGKARPPVAGLKKANRRPLPQSPSWSVLDVSCPPLATLRPVRTARPTASTRISPDSNGSGGGFPTRTRRLAALARTTAGARPGHGRPERYPTTAAGHPACRARSQTSSAPPNWNPGVDTSERKPARLYFP